LAWVAVAFVACVALDAQAQRGELRVEGGVAGGAGELIVKPAFGAECGKGRVASVGRATGQAVQEEAGIAAGHDIDRE
jgi:hypothetical protein